jgi:hypothetical protein
MIPLPSRPRFSLKPRLRPLAVWCSVALLGVSHVPLRAQSPVFSEDFESGSLNPAVWDTRTAGDVAITVQQTQVAHGKSALQVHYPKGGSRSYGFIVATHLPDSVRAHFFGRAYVFISPPAPAGHDVLLNAGAPGYPLSNFLELGASGGKNVMMSYQQNAADAPRGETIARGIAYPVGRWFCLEWEFTDHPDHIVAWIDGAPAGELAGFTFKPRAARGARPSGVADATIPNARPDPAANPAPAAAIPGTDLVKGFSDFAFGFRAWGAGAKEDFDIYYDDIAIDTKRIGPLP